MAKQIVRNWRFQDLTGQRFGNLVVVAEAPPQPRKDRKTSEVAWLCKCDCGNECELRASDLKAGNTKSCGCLRASEKGQSYSLEYAIWGSMIARCRNPKQQAYKNYGGRGIDVHQPWVDSFSAWAEHMGPRPSRKHTLDRIDNNGNYEPGNVRWATTGEQRRNSRSNRMLTLNGKTQCMTDWAKEYGIDKRTLRGRLARGWSLEKALVTPPDSRRRPK